VSGHVYGSLSTPIAIDALIEEYKRFPLKFEPGMQYGYNNAGYFVPARKSAPPALQPSRGS
jgi:hypothetical protein